MDIQNKWALAAALFAAAAAGPAIAKEPDLDEARPEAFTALLGCRDIADAAARLACYDDKVAALQAADRDKSIVIVDKEQVKKARRGLFGFKLPSLRLFGGGEESDEAIDEIATKLTGSSRGAAGELIVNLEDGSIWRQNDNRPIFTPKPGSEVTVKRGALGTYFVSIKDRPGFRAKRQD